MFEKNYNNIGSADKVLTKEEKKILLELIYNEQARIILKNYTKYNYDKYNKLKKIKDKTLLKCLIYLIGDFM